MSLGLAFALSGPSADVAAAQSRRDRGGDGIASTRPAGKPVMAIVSLNQQRVTVYDAEGAVLQAPVSTGQVGYETPAGIYTVLEKRAEHYSNLYDDASMPFMQRLTWSGIALHAGVLPGYRASHGCIRMPLGFAGRLFERSTLGMRVIVVRDDISPAEFSHPALFKPLGETPSALPTASATFDAADAVPARIADASVRTDAAPMVARPSLKAIAAAKSAAAASAARKLEEARSAARQATVEAAHATKALRRALALKTRAEQQRRLALERAGSDMQAKSAAEATFAETQGKLDLAKAEAEAKADLAQRLRQQIKEADEANIAATEEAKEAARKLLPVSVFISRATQRLYVRQAREPLLESAVTIADADTPLGTYVFTAVAYTNGESDLRWSAVSMYRTQRGPEGGKRRDGNRPTTRQAGVAPADLAGARVALDRIAIPKDAAERISEIVSPGSALIVSDEGLSRETGKATEFIVVMSNEPQGGIKIRRRPAPEARYRYQRPYGGGSPFGWNSRPFSWW